MIQNPHDLLFKAVFGQLEHARSLLRAILPAQLADAIDWAQLTPWPGAFVDLVQTPRYADLLFATRWRGPAAEPLHLLFEHQSSPSAEDLMAHRLLRYMGRSWDQWRTDHPRARTLPAIIPVVLYHGKLPWPEPRAFHALLAVPAPLRPACEPHLVRFEYLLHDLSTLSDAELCAGDLPTPLAKLVTVCFKYAWAGPQLLAVLDRSRHLVREVARAPAGRDSLEQVLRYILEVAEPIEERELRALLDRALDPQPTDTLMTLAEQYIEKGRKEGAELARREAAEQARLSAEQARLSAEQARQALLLRQVRKRFGAAVNATIEERIARASREQVEAWADRVLSAATIDEMFAPE